MITVLTPGTYSYTDTEHTEQPMETVDTLQVLVAAAQKGDLDAFETIIQRFQGIAYYWAYAMLGDQSLAEDTVQEAFIEAYLSLPQLREPSAFPGWLRRLIFKQGNRLTRNKQFTTIPWNSDRTSNMVQEDLNPEMIIEDKEQRTTIREAILKLPEHERIVIALFYDAGYSIKDIADFLEVPLSTVKKRLFDARRHLRNKLATMVREAQPIPYESSEERFPAYIRLMIAIRKYDLPAVKSLLAYDPLLVHARAIAPLGKAVSFLPPTGYTALHEAAVNGYTELIAILLAYGANINARTNYGTTPLQEAVLANQYAVATLLLAQGALIDLHDGTPLQWAVQRGHEQLVKLLLEAHTPVNIPGPTGRTPLHWAAIKGHTRITQLLLTYGADGSCLDELGRTPLDWAHARNHQHIVALLQPSEKASTHSTQA